MSEVVRSKSFKNPKCDAYCASTSASTQLNFKIFKASEFDHEKVLSLLDNFELVRELYEQSIQQEDFVLFLFKFFEVNGRLSELLKWVILREVLSTSDSGEICRGETLGTRMLYTLFFSEVGLKYLTSILKDLITHIIEVPSSLELEEDRIKEGLVNPKTNILWFLQEIESFIEKLVNSIDECPFALREGFTILRTAVASKFPESLSIVCSIFFLRFVCPSFINAVKFGLLTEEEYNASPFGSRGLVIISKLLQHLANCSKIEKSKSYSESFNQFMKKYHKKLLGFINVFTEKIDVSQASVYSTQSSETIKKIAEENLQNHLLFSHCGRELEIGLLYRNARDILLDIYRSPIDSPENTNNDSEYSWKIALQDKKRNITIYESKAKNQPFSVLKAISTFPTDMTTMFQMLRDYTKLVKFDSRLSHCDLVEKHEDEVPPRNDWYIETDSSFPFSGKDWLLSMCEEYGERQSILSMFSITRTDRPPLKKVIRGRILGSGYVIDAIKNNPSSVLVTTVQQSDFKGKHSNHNSSNSLMSLQKELYRYFVHSLPSVKEKLHVKKGSFISKNETT